MRCPNGGTLSGGSTCTGVGGANSTTAYLYLGGKLIAEHDSVAGILYSHTDGLGSPVARTNGQGGIVAKTRFEAYGAVAQGFTPTGANSVGFTGHVNDAETLLVYMQQRYYDPVAGRFMSSDPVVTDANTGKGFGLYTYVDNNPYTKIDPDGREGEEKFKHGDSLNWKDAGSGLPGGGEGRVRAAAIAAAVRTAAAPAAQAAAGAAAGVPAMGAAAIVGLALVPSTLADGTLSNGPSVNLKNSDSAELEKISSPLVPSESRMLTRTTLLQQAICVLRQLE